MAASREKSVVFCVVRAYRLLRRAIRGRTPKIFNASDGLRVSGQPIAKLNVLYCSFLCSSSCFECYVGFSLTDASKSDCGVPEGRTWHTLTFIAPDRAVLYGGLSQYNAVLSEYYTVSQTADDVMENASVILEFRDKSSRFTLGWFFRLPDQWISIGNYSLFI